MLALSAFDIVLISLLGLVALLAGGGYLVNARRREAESERLHEMAERADHALARAHAEDKGWQREALEAAARRAFGQRHPGTVLRDVVLVQVVDRAGTEDDKAVFQAVTDDGTVTLRLGRRGDEWYAEG